MWLGSSTTLCLRSHDEPLQDYGRDSFACEEEGSGEEVVTLQVSLFHASETQKFPQTVEPQECVGMTVIQRQRKLHYRQTVQKDVIIL